MSIAYRLYADAQNGTGGPILYGSPVASTSSLSWTSGPLSGPGKYSFLLRPYDTVSGYEDQSADARVSITIDAAGNDITALPNAPTGLSVQQTAGGGARFVWLYNPGGQGAAPRRFDLYLGTPTVDYSVSRGNSAYWPGRAMSAMVAGLTPGSTYQAVVRAENTSGQETNTNTLTFTVPAGGPSPVAALTATAVP